jgi:hypothetical protein
LRCQGRPAFASLLRDERDQTTSAEVAQATVKYHDSDTYGTHRLSFFPLRAICWLL